MVTNYGAEGQQNHTGNRFSFRQALQVTAAVITSPLKAMHSRSTPSQEFVSSLERIAQPGCTRVEFIKRRFEESTSRSPLLYTLGCLLKFNTIESQRKNGGIRAVNLLRATGIVLTAPFFETGGPGHGDTVVRKVDSTGKESYELRESGRKGNWY